MTDHWWSRLFKKHHKESAFFNKTKDGSIFSRSTLIAKAQQTAQTLPDLLLASNKVANTVLTGSHGCKRTGQGNQFWQYRLAMPGEPVHTIDWRQSAKSDKIFVRETEEENIQTLNLWCDVSGSMQWRSSSDLPTKQERAYLLGLSLSTLLLNAGERVRLINKHTSNNAFQGVQQLYTLAERLVAPSVSASPDFPVVEQLPAHAWTVLISDFLYPYDQLADFLKKLVQRPNHILLIQAIDPAEQTFPYKGRIEFSGLEGEEAITLSNDVQSSQHYATLWTEHQNQLKTLCQNINISIIQDISNVNAAYSLLSAWNILSNKRNAKSR
ncbi:DUF58 domain-containing protein [Commensalibacter oyaizuii]|uniref:DUF58 domain-containing protein n=1 Tax=Commensalibacter oyaizuii TaxID=3043873 RepID=A0ABT6Q0N3_9PROT|nr:DUF58 domain-containing protein [Commensalibacter sp. TBRC 16381]MDI2090653.1 DUF58 domain-containing protein [Commensalibacter sp. TBRC 16381]